MAVRLQDYLLRRVRELCKLPHETEWAEFKRNFSNPDDIGEYISALSNSAALAGKQHGYVLWGIEDQTHEVVGTGFAPSRAKKGSEDLTGWLARLLNPQIEFMFHELELKGLRVVLLEIPRAVLHPVRFKSEEFIRIGSYTKKLKDFPERERELWRILGTTPFENLVALKDVAADSVLHLLDYPAYFKLLNLPLPSGKMGVLEALAADRLIMASEAGNWDITNLGAILFATRLADFPELGRKVVRVIAYAGTSKINRAREQLGVKGYANGFEGLIDYINGLLPSNEVLGEALQRTIPMFPELAVRELVANALIHQDFFVSGAGPMVEIYDDRIEVSNPGRPLVDPERFLDMPLEDQNIAQASRIIKEAVDAGRIAPYDRDAAPKLMKYVPNWAASRT